MADINKLIPHIIKWETGVSRQAGETLEKLFERARRKGYANDPADKGGVTQTGVTFSTFTKFRKQTGRAKPTVTDLRNITFNEWREVLTLFFWDKIQAQAINNDNVACMIVDWFWGSGAWALKNSQKVLGVKQDGIFGVKTLAAINGWRYGSKHLWNALKTERVAYYKRIAKGSQAKFLKGWLNRVNDLRYE